MCKQNLSGHECCIMPNHISLSDFVLNRVCRLVLFWILLRGLNSDMWLCVPRDFFPVVRPNPAQPSPARPGPAWPACPWRSCPPYAPPLPWSFPLISILLRSNVSLSSTSPSLPVVPYVLETVIAGIWIPVVSPFLFFLLSPTPRALPWSCGPGRALPWPRAIPRPCPARRLGPAPLRLRAPAASRLRAPGARSRFARSGFARVRLCRAMFNFQFNPFFNFSLVDVLRRALRHATIHFKFIFINELCRALRRTTFHFKFGFDDVCHRAFRRVMLNVYL
jgi:hypothetical protein